MVGKVDNAKYFSEVIDAKRAANVKIRLGYFNIHQMLCQLDVRVPSTMIYVRFKHTMN